MSLDLLGISNIVSGVGKVADDLFTSDEERLKIALQEKSIEADLVKGQLEINKVEAGHASLFVAGWRPFIGWVGGVALAYQFILYPLMVWGWSLFKAHGWVPPTLEPPPVLPADQLWVVLSGMLGIAGLRSFDKLKGTDTPTVGKPKAS
ncbi:holin family protein [Ferriphaselus sp. R-1]|uniref:holin family protein n=1 Tax=Ferriphaselus sp. R-1 TaxID=1485544 RepID=UPI00068D2121|nr:holin family protein [Ferriphaselus sp. R-1]